MQKKGASKSTGSIGQEKDWRESNNEIAVCVCHVYTAAQKKKERKQEQSALRPKTLSDKRLGQKSTRERITTNTFFSLHTHANSLSLYIYIYIYPHSHIFPHICFLISGTGWAADDKGNRAIINKHIGCDYKSLKREKKNICENSVDARVGACKSGIIES